MTEPEDSESDSGSDSARAPPGLPVGPPCAGSRRVTAGVTRPGTSRARRPRSRWRASLGLVCAKVHDSKLRGTKLHGYNGMPAAASASGFQCPFGYRPGIVLAPGRVRTRVSRH